MKLPNNSYFNYAKFKTDDDYREGNFVYAPVTMWGVDGIVYRACTWENAQLTTPTHTSSQLGKGIYSIDASYTVRGNCNTTGLPYGTPCPTGQLDRSEFIGFDHAISALGTAGSSSSFRVFDTKFTDNICGVYANGVVGYQVKRCELVLGGRVVTLDGDVDQEFNSRHRGIYSTESWAFAVDDNLLSWTGPHVETEGIVIGYSRDHNDIVFRNDAASLERGYIGEGIAADPAESYTGLRGLQFFCNHNFGNTQNLWSRKVLTDQSAPELHTIRTNQGYWDRPADNTFDLLPGPEGVGDFKVTTTNGNILYWNRGTGNFHPQHYTQSPEANLIPVYPLYAPANNCASKITTTIPNDTGHPSGMALQPIRDHLLAQKLAYGNTRYLYDQLIDGGSTDEVVEEITDAWPQDFLELRAYLLGKSPYLSVDALMRAMNKYGLPDAIRAEVCIANPEATQKRGFVKWLQHQCTQPLPEYLIDNIIASWNLKTYRSTLEATMANQHAEMTQAANMLLHRHADDVDGAAPEELRAVWQLVRTPAARYAEAITYLEQGQFANATAVITGLPMEHNLKAPEAQERQRMLNLIALMQPIRSNGRTDAQLTVGEVDALEALRGNAYDRPATWISNLICFHYGRCRAPLSGGEEESPKALRPRALFSQEAEAPIQLSIHPNPASSWVAFDYDLRSLADGAELAVMDVTGRIVWSTPLSTSKYQVLWDVRGAQPGSYTVELRNASKHVATEQLILQP